MKKELLSQFFEDFYEGIFYVDKQKSIKYWSAGLEKLIGISQEQALDKKYFEIVPFFDEKGNRITKERDIIEKSLKHLHIYDLTCFVKSKPGKMQQINVRTIPMYDVTSRLIGISVIFMKFRDLTFFDEDSFSEYISSFFDPITEIPNVFYVKSILKTKFAEFHRYHWKFGALLFEIDNYRQNKTIFGEELGAKILRTTAEKLKHKMRSFDIFGKWSESEFMLVFVNVTERKLFKLAERMREIISSCHIELGEGKLQLSISVGCTILKDDDTLEMMIRRLQNYKEYSKLKGGNNVTNHIFQ